MIVKEEERDEKEEIKLSRLIKMLTKKDLDRMGISKKGRKIYILVVNAPYLAWRSQLVQQRQPGVQLHQDGQGH